VIIHIIVTFSADYLVTFLYHKMLHFVVLFFGQWIVAVGDIGAQPVVKRKAKLRIARSH